MPALPYDVLILLMAHLSPGSVSRLMRTCHTLYSLGVSRLLRDISLLSNEAAISFSLFLDAQSDTFNCCRYIRRLVLVIDSVTESVPSLDTLARTLEDAAALQYLQINAPMSSGKEERIYAAIGSLSALEYLSLGMPTPRTVLQSLVEKLRGSLKAIDFPRIGDEGFLECELVDAESLLNPVSSTLQELSIRIAIPTIAPLTPVFTALKKLHLYGIGGRIALAPLIHYFPNLRELSTEKFREAEHIMLSIETGLYMILCRGCRDDNKPLRSCWSHLRQLRAPLYFVYALGLTARLEKLELLAVFRAKDVEVLADVVQDTSPANISFKYSASRPACLIKLCEALVRVGSAIQCLTVILHHNEMEWASVSHLLEFVVCRLRGLPLEELRIATRFLPDANTARQHPELAVLHDELEFFDVDGPSLLSQANSSIPSLHTLCVQVEEPPTIQWQVSIPQGDAILVLDDPFDR